VALELGGEVDVDEVGVADEDDDAESEDAPVEEVSSA
jgi:hypothetical protein